MDDLIAALQIFRRYTSTKHPTHCEHDVLHVAVSPEKVSAEDKAALEKLSFSPNEWDGFSSFRFGSC